MRTKFFGTFCNLNLVLGLIILIALMINVVSLAENVTSLKTKNFVIVTYVGSNENLRAAKAFIKSIRERSGDYQDSEIFVVLGNPGKIPADELKDGNVKLIHLQMDKDIRNYPLALKAFAIAQVEKIVKGKAKTLAWFDPGVLVLNSISELDLHDKYDAALRPVSLSNTISIPPGKEPNDYWSPLYQETGVDYKTLNTLKTVVDEVEMQPYYNCEVYSINPNLGICEEWTRVLTKIIRDEQYQSKVCTSFLKRLFLHQAVLSTVISSKVRPERIKPLPITSSYPFNQHKQLKEVKRITTLNDASIVIFDYAWARVAGWMNNIKVISPLKEWLIDTFIDYSKLSDNIYRLEGSCNSYLMTTEGGSVLIDPGGASVDPRYFKKIFKKYPLKAILITHAHKDHWEGYESFKFDSSVPIITQRKFVGYTEYWRRLLEFFARRGAIWRGNPIPKPEEIKPYNPLVPTQTFIDTYTYKFGDLQFIMTHTPGETPDHTTIWIPELKAVFVGDNYFKYFINNATLRGTLTRPVLGYIKALTLALSYKPEFFLMGHDTPIIGATEIEDQVGKFRDGIQYINDETIKRINQGKDVYTIMQEIKVPEKYGLRFGFGKLEWTIRGIYHENIGWFDENPSSMYAIPPSSVHTDIVKLIGSAEKIAEYAQKYLDEKDYLRVLHLTDIALNAEPTNKKVLEVRLKALNGLKQGPYNYIERVWLNYGISRINNILNPKSKN